MTLKTVLLAGLVALVILMLLQNMATVSIRLLFWSVSAPLLVFLLGALFIGIVLGWFSHLAYFKGKYKRNLDSRKGSNN